MGQFFVFPITAVALHFHNPSFIPGEPRLLRISFRSLELKTLLGVNHKLIGYERNLVYYVLRFTTPQFALLDLSWNIEVSPHKLQEICFQNSQRLKFKIKESL
jgi:hypothetical protein